MTPEGSDAGAKNYRSRVLIVRWGDIRVHDLNLAKVLSKHHEVEFAVATPHYGYRGAGGRSVIDEVSSKFKVREWRASALERQSSRLSRVLGWVGLQLPILLVGITFPGRLARHISEKAYDIILPVEQHSLYCAWRAALKSRQSLSKIIYYSLEVQTLGDDDVNSHLRRMLIEERRIVHEIGGILIQDMNRLKVLGDDLPTAIPQVYLLPLFSDRPVVAQRSVVLRETFGIDPRKRILLYFGAFYAERMIDAIVQKFCEADRKNVVLVLHNPQMTRGDAARFRQMSPNVFPSTRFLSEDELDCLVSSADLGIALYDNDKPNTRFTAFSSEKIVTYLRCGVPFIAFDNESYRELRSRHDCCVLIASVDHLGKAMDTLLSQPEHYAREAQLAYGAIFQRTELEIQAGPSALTEKSAQAATSGPEAQHVPPGPDRPRHFISGSRARRPRRQTAKCAGSSDERSK